MDSGFCINCGSAGGSMLLENEQILRCIQGWAAPLSIQASDIVCTTCWTLAQENIRSPSKNNIGRNCALCNKTMCPRTRSHQVISLRTDSLHHRNIKSIIIERLLPLKVHASHYICHPCWQRADRAARHYSLPSSTKQTPTRSNQLRCANCGINLIRMRRHILNDNAILLQVQQQVAPQVVRASDYICGACHDLLTNHFSSGASQAAHDPPIIGHQHLCLTCGVSLTKRRRHSLNAESNQYIVDIVRSWIQPREIEESHLLCHRCYQRADAAAVNAILPPKANPSSQQDESVTLPNYSRASDTHRRCIFIDCNSTSQKNIPFVLRVRLFRDHNFYIPPGCRICEQHLTTQPWSDILEAENVNHQFKATHIEDFIELLKNDKCVVDFENIDEMDDNLVWYWIGRTKQQFMELLTELPQFNKRATALGAYLMKIRTGDSDERISCLLNIPRSTLSKLMTSAREIMYRHFHTYQEWKSQQETCMYQKLCLETLEVTLKIERQ